MSADSTPGQAMNVADYPEHDKLNAISGQSQLIGAFLENLPAMGLVLAEVDASGEVWPAYQSTNVILARYFGIDLAKLDAEKRDMLARLRAGAR